MAEETAPAAADQQLSDGLDRIALLRHAPGRSASLDAKGPLAGNAQFNTCAGGTKCATPVSSFYAEFYSSSTPSSCWASDGACSYYACDPTGGGSTTYASAGELFLWGAFGELASEPRHEIYNLHDLPEDWGPGASVALSANGKVFPGFAQQTVVMPEMVTMTAPSANAKGKFVLPTSSDLAVEWSGGAGGTTMIVQAASTDGTAGFSCYWDASSGAGDVPQAALAALAGKAASLSWGPSTYTSVTIGADVAVIYADLYSTSAASFQ